MLSAFLLVLLFGSAPLLHADSDHLNEANVKRVNIQKTGMIILGSWALTNFAVSGYSMTRQEDRQFYFHQMNVLWNTVNLTIAGFGYAGAVRSGTDAGFAETLREYRSFSKVLAVNAALDVGYIAAGFYLKSRGAGSEQHGERLIGYGNSLILQGGFLLAFDAVMLLINQGALSQFEAAADDTAAGTLSFNLAALPGGLAARLSW